MAAITVKAQTLKPEKHDEKCLSRISATTMTVIEQPPTVKLKEHEEEGLPRLSMTTITRSSQSRMLKLKGLVEDNEEKVLVN